MSSAISRIPKIIHQIWIGPKPAPSAHMDTWTRMNPDFEYHRWTEAELATHQISMECQHRIDEMEELCGKTDIIRLELLYRFGGIYIDADSICVSPIDDRLMDCPYFAGWEHEQLRPGLIATGTMGFPPRHPLVKAMIDWIKGNCVNAKITGKRAWQITGPVLLTRMYNTGKYSDGVIFPSYSFLPIHYTGAEYNGHGKIYAYQEWGSTKQNYEIMNQLTLPSQFLPPAPEESVSILASSWNTPDAFMQQCLQSIAAQEGSFHMELVWVDDGSDELHSGKLRQLLKQFEQSCRFVTVVYMKNEENKGVGYSLNRGVQRCSHEIILRMDSDDIMVNTRVWKQFEFMKKNPTVKLCGGQIHMFNEAFEMVGQTHHPSITLDQYKQVKSAWFLNHPTACFRKSAMLAAGNYNETWRKCEDFECFLRMLKMYGFIYNFPEILLYYRIHPGQVTKYIPLELKETMRQLVQNL